MARATRLVVRIKGGFQITQDRRQPLPRWQSRRPRRVSRTGVAVLLLLASVVPALAQIRIPANEIDIDEQTGACTVTLIPAMTAGDAPPSLIVTASGKPKPDRIAIDLSTPSGVASAELVYRNSRNEFTPVSPRPIDKVMRSEIWTAIADADDRLPFFLTTKSPDGHYSSARYQGLDPKGIIAILQSQCGFRAKAAGAARVDQVRERERRLGLSDEQITHIRWVLNSRYGNAQRTPVSAAILTGPERGYLTRYSQAIGQPASRYLTRTLADRLIAEKFVAAAPDHAAQRGFSTHEDWQIYRTDTGICVISSPATRWTGLFPYTRPEMMFSIEPKVPGNALAFDLVTPNPFRATSPVSARVDGQRYRLQQVGGRILPPVSGDGLDDAVMKAFRRGRNIEFRGIAAESGRAASVFFSASGFTAAFQQAGRKCRRPGLRDWFR